MAKPEQVKAVVAKLLAAFDEDRFSRERLAVYVEMLADIPFEELLAAADSIIATGKYPRMPTVADIRRSVGEARVGHLPDAETAWLEVKQTIRKVGFYGVPQFSSDLVADAVASIGWETLCSMEITQSSIYSAQFKRAYETFRNRLERSHALGLPSPKRTQIDQAKPSGRVGHQPTDPRPIGLGLEDLFQGMADTQAAGSPESDS